MSYSQDQRINGAIREIERSADLNPAIKALLKRETEIGGHTTAVLAGIALHPPARRQFEKMLDEIWSSDLPQPYTTAEEVVIGAGPHAAIYAATRAQLGYKPPLILTDGRVGGSFAASIEPSFYLNSRNRPGKLSLPLQAGALNVIPGSSLQPSHISNDEYQRNSDMAFVTRAAIALSGAEVVKGKVSRIERIGTEVRLQRRDGKAPVRTNRLIVATGLGEQLKLPGQDEASASGRVDTFASFMARFDKPFPLQGLERVAVIGGGDSGKTVIEALTGRGPQAQMSVAALDYPRRIDWYGVSNTVTCESYLSKTRSRYKGIAPLLPVSQSEENRARVTPRGNAESIAAGFDSVYVDERPYDHVIVCAGILAGSERAMLSSFALQEHLVGSRRVAQRAGNVYVVGPAATLPVDGRENRSTNAYALAPENEVALFRYADRTAALAASLPGTKVAKAKTTTKRVKASKTKTEVQKVEVRNNGSGGYRWSLYRGALKVPGERGYSVKANAESRADWINGGRKGRAPIS